MTMDRLHVLGTGNAMVTKIFNTCAVLELSGKYLLLDCGGGNGILQRLEAAQIDTREIHDVFISHEHCDHLLGAVWIVRNAAAKMLNGKFDGDLRIYCHQGLVDTIKTLCELCLQKKFTKLIGKRIQIISLKDKEKKEIIGKDFTFFDIRSTKATQFGFVTTLTNGEKLSFMGDEPINSKCELYAENASWLLCEAFCLLKDALRFKPYEKHHSTVADAAKLAERLNVKHMLLWHTEQATGPMRKVAYTSEAAEFFNGEVIVPNDLDIVSLS
ncbi:MAG: MBL fold metallo-hydrolase [Christensenella sp.]